MGRKNFPGAKNDRLQNQAKARAQKQKLLYKRKTQEQALRAGVDRSRVYNLSEKRLQLETEAIKVGVKRGSLAVKTEKQLRKSIANKKHRNKLKKDAEEKRKELGKQFESVLTAKKHGNKPRPIISNEKINKISWKDINSGNISREKYSFLYPELSGFDFDKVYTLKDGQRMFFAYRDYTGETDFTDLIRENSKLTNEQMLDKLEGIVNRPINYSKSAKKKSGGEKGGSDGKPGDYRYECGRQNVITETSHEAYNKNRRKATRTKDASHPGFQVLKNGGRNSFSQVTPRNLLIVANSIMYNVTELERVGFYEQFRADVIYHIPEMDSILPK